METREKVTRVRLELDRDYQFVATYPDSPSGNPIRLDEAPPLGAGTGPNPVALLATAIGNCLASSLLFCLRRARVQPNTMTATAEVRLVRNEAGRYRVQEVDVELMPEIPGADLARLQRCERLFEDFCIVTESVRAGIDVNISVRAGDPSVVSQSARA